MDTVCSLPSCDWAAVDCEADDEPCLAGPSSSCRRLPLCAVHHRLKQSRGWRVRTGPDGSELWTTPAGLAVTRPLLAPGTEPPPVPAPWRVVDPGEHELDLLRAAIAAAAAPPPPPDTWDRAGDPPW